MIGICGSAVKCKFLTEELGFDGAINYKTDDIPAALKRLCPDGIDCYFDNVGGDISDHITRQMNQNSAIAVCGQISTYNQDVGFLPPPRNEIGAIIKDKNINREFFAVYNYKGNFKLFVVCFESSPSIGSLQCHPAKDSVLQI